MKWVPSRIWEGRQVVLIGGGPSLASFDFARLGGKSVIGCNDAFRLGPALVPFCIFGDQSWWERNKWELEQYAQAGGKVFTCSASPAVHSYKLDWLQVLQREKQGLHEGNGVGWNASTGAAAINLALNLGGREIFLLGYDLGKQGTKTHWHSHARRDTQEEVYLRFCAGFEHIVRALPKFAPNCRVVNVSNGSSRLRCFPTISFENFWGMLQ